MKLVSNFITLLICFELLVAPLGQGLGIINQNTYAAECSAGQTFNSELNRCLTSDETAQVMHATQSCNGDRDCYMTNATAALDKKIADGSAKSYMGLNRASSGLVTTVTTAVPIAMAFALGSMTGSCSGVSFWLFIGAGAAMFFGDMFINMAHYGRLKKIKSDWGKIVSPTDAGGDLDKERELSSTAQAEAFGKLSEAEKSLATAASSKATLYWVAAAAYAAAGITAGLEQMNVMSMSPCKVGASGGGAPGVMVGFNHSSTSHFELENYLPNTETGEKIHQEKELFDFYSHKTEPLTFPTDQHYYNILNATDFTSLIMTQKSFEQKYSSPTIDQYELVSKSLHEVKNLAQDAPEAFEIFKKIISKVGKELNPIQLANAKEDKSKASIAFEEDGKTFDAWTWMSLLGGAGIGVTIGLVTPKISGMMVSSTGRMILGGVLAVMAGMLAKHAGAVASNATERSEVLSKMKADFQGSSNALYTCKSEDRDDPGKPNCYCYTPENQRNSNRGSSQVCQKLWAGANVNFKNTFATADTSKICVNNNRSADPNCSCKKTGTCLKSSIGAMNGVNSGTMRMVNSGLTPLNDLTGGNSSFADLQASNPQLAALRMMNARKEMLNSPQFSKLKDKIQQGETQLEAQIGSLAAKAPSSNLLEGNISSIPKNPKEAARMLEKELSPTTPTAVSGNQGTIVTPDGSEDKVPEFGLSETQREDQKAQVSELMKNEFDYRGNEINDSSKSNIFEVLSNRYQKSGMKKLFDDNEKK